MAPKKKRDWMPLVLAGIAVLGIILAFVFSGNTSATVFAGVVTIVTIFQGEAAYKTERWKRNSLFVAYGVIAVLAAGMSFSVVDAGKTTLFAANETASVARAYWVAVVASLVAALFWLVKLKMDPPPVTPNAAAPTIADPASPAVEGADQDA